jgi:hypothetical protein
MAIIPVRPLNRRRFQTDDAQQFLRATNQEIRRLISELGSEDSDFVCECSAKDCHELMRMTAEEFDAFAATANGMPLVVRNHR